MNPFRYLSGNDIERVTNRQAWANRKDRSRPVPTDGMEGHFRNTRSLALRCASLGAAIGPDGKSGERAVHEPPLRKSGLPLKGVVEKPRCRRACRHSSAYRNPGVSTLSLFIAEFLPLRGVNRRASPPPSALDPAFAGMTNKGEGQPQAKRGFFNNPDKGGKNDALRRGVLQQSPSWEARPSPDGFGAGLTSAYPRIRPHGVFGATGHARKAARRPPVFQAAEGARIEGTVWSLRRSEEHSKCK